MGFLDKIKNMVNKNKRKVTSGVDKATDVIDDKSDDKHTDNLQEADDAAGQTADTKDV
ncbi:MAG: hypothetical protein ACJAXA_003126 [Candidatus Aldehydirespiratoraceae bacterium]|jgi:hypothetical protein